MSLYHSYGKPLDGEELWTEANEPREDESGCQDSFDVCKSLFS